MNLFVFLLVVTFLTHIIKNGDGIFGKVRNILFRLPFLGPKLFIKLFDCNFCLGFWLSLIVSTFDIFINNQKPIFLPTLFYMSMAGASFNMLYWSMIEFLISNIKVEINNN